MCTKSLVSEGLNHTDELFQMNNDRPDFAIQPFNECLGNSYHVQSTALGFFPVTHASVSYLLYVIVKNELSHTKTYSGLEGL